MAILLWTLTIGIAVALLATITTWFYHSIFAGLPGKLQNNEEVRIEAILEIDQSLSQVYVRTIQRVDGVGFLTTCDRRYVSGGVLSLGSRYRY